MQTKYFVSELYSEHQFTAAVGRKDVEDLLSGWGFLPIHFSEEKKGLSDKTTRYLHLMQLVRKIKRNDIVFFHFPVYSRAKKLLLSALRQKGVYCIAYVNDMEGLRDRNEALLKKELKTLSLFSGAIVLNETMQNWVAGQCPNLHLSAITIWDYLAETIPLSCRQKTATVAFAGNQQKAGFIRQLDQVNGITFHLYGTPVFPLYPTNCVVHGETDAKKLPLVMEGSFGLVWDGPSVDSCQGGEGEYLRINSPYKLSLYLLAGMPLLIWKEAALAKWVTGNGYGLALDSLRSLPVVINALSEREYQQLVDNIKTVQPLIATGQFLKKAVEEQLRPIV